VGDKVDEIDGPPGAEGPLPGATTGEGGADGQVEAGALDADTQEELKRLKAISSAVAEFDPEVRGEAFTRLASVSAPGRRTLSFTITGAVITGLGVATLTGAWYARHSNAWRDAWQWLNHGTLHPWPLILAAGISSAAIGALVLSGFSPVGKVPTAFVAVAGGISAVTAAVFALSPNLAPSTQRSFTITNVRVEPHVSLEQYRQLNEVANVLAASSGWSFPAPSSKDADQQGFVVDFSFEAQGLRDKSVGFRWLLFDASTGKLAWQSNRYTDVWCEYETTHTPSPCLVYGGSFKDRDDGSFGLWVGNAPRAVGGRHAQSAVVDKFGSPMKCVVARVEAYDESGGNRLAYGDTPAFPGAANASTVCRAPAWL
jgi:hypothetical protein